VLAHVPAARALEQAPAALDRERLLELDVRVLRSQGLAATELEVHIKWSDAQSACSALEQQRAPCPSARGCRSRACLARGRERTSHRAVFAFLEITPLP